MFNDFFEHYNVVFDDFDTWMNQGLELADAGLFEKALQFYDKAIEINQDDFSAWCTKGIALDNLSRYEEALQAYDKALELNPEDIFSWKFNRHCT